MDDLIRRLADANPEPHLEPVDFAAIARRLERDGQSGRRADAPARRMTDWTLAAVVAAVCAAVLLVTVMTGGRRSGSAPGPSQGAAARQPPAPLAHRHRSGVPRQDCGDPVPAGERTALAPLLAEVGLLRTPVGPAERSASACVAARVIANPPGAFPYAPQVTVQPLDLRYAGPGITGGAVYMYVEPGLNRGTVSRALPRTSTLAAAEEQPAVCLISVGADTAADPTGCTPLRSLSAGPRGFQAAQIPGTATSVLSGVVRDGIAAVRVEDGTRVIAVAAVHDNLVQVVVRHNAAYAADLRIVPVT